MASRRLNFAVSAADSDSPWPTLSLSLYICIYIYIYIYILEFSCRYPSTDDRLVAWIVQFKLTFCFLALFTMSAFCSKCPAKVSPEMAVPGPLWRQAGSGTAVLRALGRQVGPVMAVVGALGRQGGLERRLEAKTGIMSPCRPEVLGGTFCIDILINSPAYRPACR